MRCVSDDSSIHVLPFPLPRRGDAAVAAEQREALARAIEDQRVTEATPRPASLRSPGRDPWADLEQRLVCIAAREVIGIRVVPERAAANGEDVEVVSVEYGN
jgi:hypothetical protein